MRPNPIIRGWVGKIKKCDNAVFAPQDARYAYVCLEKPILNALSMVQEVSKGRKPIQPDTIIDDEKKEKDRLHHKTTTAERGSFAASCVHIVLLTWNSEGLRRV